MTVLATIGGCAVICGFNVWCCISLVTKEREQVYILDEMCIRDRVTAEETQRQKIKKVEEERQKMEELYQEELLREADRNVDLICFTASKRNPSIPLSIHSFAAADIALYAGELAASSIAP